MRRVLSLSWDGSGNFRSIRVVVPFKLDGAKSRLAPALNPEERRLLAFAMARDVLRTVSEFGTVTVLSRPGLYPEDIEIVGDVFEILESDLDLNDALNELIEREASRGWMKDILIVMADLALLAKNDIIGILNCPGDVVLCPGRGGGTNMILINSPVFRTCYRGLSFPKHLAFASGAGLEATVFESFRASSDIDQPEDLVELLLHGRGEARALIEQMGFSLSDEARALAASNGPVMLRHDPADSRIQM
ncbi:MAG: 2-phospho-L-lactate guanylyltransferase [Methanothrix sp.]|nr:2-phospho-L-lactate guanylyltransferase [Methanothrix sp.]